MIRYQVDHSGLDHKVRVLREQGFDDPTLLELIGQRQLAWIDDNFQQSGIERRWKPLSPNTLAIRQGGKTLMDTGRLRGSFGKNINSGLLWVGTRDERSQWHHEGTRPYSIRPVRAKALRFMTAGGPVFRKHVNHPGLPARPLLPSLSLAKRMSRESVARLYDRITQQL